MGRFGHLDSNRRVLLATEDGLPTCAQEYWAQYSRTLAALFELPGEVIVFCGMALRYAEDHPINTLRTRRDSLLDWAAMRGFD
jgi:hypothetical protein